MRRRLSNTFIGAFVTVVLSATGCDPAPPQFVGGVELLDGGAVMVHYGECSDRPLRRFTLYERHGEREQTPLWDVRVREPVDATSRRDTTGHVGVGRVPAGFIEDLPYGGALPPGPLLDATFNFTEEPSATVGVFFKFEDLEEGKVWTKDWGHLDVEEFRKRATNACE